MKKFLILAVIFTGCTTTTIERPDGKKITVRDSGTVFAGIVNAIGRAALIEQERQYIRDINRGFKK